MKFYLAIDIGASSGRHIVGHMDCGSLKLDEVYRFPNGVLDMNGHLIWDIQKLFEEVKNGIRIALEKYHHIESMSIDTWGVDYVLMKDNKEILPCYAYRDQRTLSYIDEIHKIISFQHLYEITGSQFQSFNTIYQFYADKKEGRLDLATRFLHIPEYLIYKLTGVMKNEYTNASTTGMLDGKTLNYAKEIIDKLGFNKNLFHDLSKPKEVVGYFKKDIEKEVHGNILVKLCPTHDTASAVEGIPMDTNQPYISSGTWSLLGIKTKGIINSMEAMKANYSNEYGPGYIRFQKNIMGLWIIQGLSKQLRIDFKTMVLMAKESDYMELYDVNDPCFLSSLNMIEEIMSWFKKRNMTLPLTTKDIINTTYRSLAYSYKMAIDELESITNQKYEKLYIVGGGAKNTYLNELTEEFTKHKVIALPIEATAIGNLLSQMEENYEK